MWDVGCGFFPRPPRPDPPGAEESLEAVSNDSPTPSADTPLLHCLQSPEGTLSNISRYGQSLVVSLMLNTLCCASPLSISRLDIVAGCMACLCQYRC